MGAFTEACKEAYAYCSSVSMYYSCCVASLREFYPEGAAVSDSFSRIATPAHFKRVKALLDNTSGEIVYGGTAIEDKKFIEPTIVVGVKGDDALMRECVFYISDPCLDI